MQNFNITQDEIMCNMRTSFNFKNANTHNMKAVTEHGS